MHLRSRMDTDDLRNLQSPVPSLQLLHGRQRSHERRDGDSLAQSGHQACGLGIGACFQDLIAITKGIRTDRQHTWIVDGDHSNATLKAGKHGLASKRTIGHHNSTQPVGDEIISSDRTA